MAKKQLNRKLMVVLLLIGLPLLAIVMIAVDYKYPFLPVFIQHMMGNNPETLEARAKSQIELAQQKEHDRLAEAETIADAEARYEKIKGYYDKDWTAEWRDIFKTIDRAIRYTHDRDDDLKLRTWKADLLNRIHNPLAAVKTWTGITQRYPDYTPARKAIVNYNFELYKEHDFFRQTPSDWLGLDKQASQLVEYLPGDPFGYLVQAQCQINLLKMKATENRGEARAQAEQYLAKAESLDANNPLLWKLRGWLILRVDYQEATAPEQRLQLLQSAESAFREAVIRNPGDSEAWYTLLNDYLVARNYLAAEDLRQWIASNTNDKSGKFEQWQKTADQWQKSTLPEIDSVLANFPDFAKLHALKASFLANQIKTYDDFATAIEQYQKALRLNPVNLLWRVNISQLYTIRAEWSAQPGDDLEMAWTILREGYYLTLPSWPASGDVSAANWPRIRAGMALPALVENSVDLYRLAGNPEIKKRYLEAAKTFTRALKDAVGEASSPYRSAQALIDLVQDKTHDQGQRTLFKVCQEIEQNGGAVNNRNFQRLTYRLALSLAQDGQPNIALALIRELARNNDLSLWGGYAYKTLFDALIDVKGPAYRAFLLEVITGLYEKLHPVNDPYYRDMMIYKARLLLEDRNRIEEGRQLLATLTGDGKTIEILRARAIGDDEARMTAFARIAERYPGDSLIVQTLADYYIRKADYARAADYLQQGLAVEPDNLTLRIRALSLKETNPATLTPDQQNDIFLQAVQSLSDPIEKARQIAAFYRNRAVALSSDNQEQSEEVRQLWQETDRACQQLAQLDSASLEACEGQFYAALMLGDAKRADTLAAQLEKRDEYNGRRLRADYLMDQKDWSNALASLETVIDLNPAALDYRFKAANVCLKLERRTEAETHLRNLLKLDIFNARANLMLVSLLEQQYGAANLTRLQIEEILQLTRQALDTDPTQPIGNLIFIVYANRYIQALYDESQSPLAGNEVKALYRQMIVQHHMEIVSRGQYLVDNFPSNDQNWLEVLRHYLDYAKLVDSGQETLTQETDLLFRKAFEQIPNSARIIALYEQYKAQQGQAGQGEKMLLDLIARSEGDAKHQAMLNLARLYLQNRQDDPAIALLEQLLAETPDSIPAVTMLGSLYLNRNDIARAGAIYEKASQSSDNPLFLIGLVDALLAGRDIDRAAEVIKRLEESPKYQDTRAEFRKQILLQKTRIALSQVQYDQALTCAEAVLKLDENQPLAWRSKCEALYNANRLDEAETAARAMLLATPSQASNARFLLARINRQRGLTSQAVSLLRDTLAADPGHLASQVLLVQILQQDRRWSDLESFYSSLAAREPQRIEYQASMGKYYLERALAEDNRARTESNPTRANEAQTQANTYFRRAIDTLSKAYQASEGNPQNRALVYDVFINALISTENYQDALAILDKNLATNPDDMNSQISRIEALARSGLPDQALAQVKTLLDSPSLSEISRILLLNQIGKAGDPAKILAWARPLAQQQANRPDYHWILAITAAYQGDSEQEVLHWQNALPHATGKLRLEILSRLANACLQTNAYQKGYEFYQQLMAAMPDAQNNAELLNNLAYARLYLDLDPQETVALARRAYYLRPGANQIVDTYATALIKTGDFRTARLLLAQVVHESVAAGQALLIDYRYHLAQALQGEGSRDRALEQVRAALTQLDSVVSETARAGWQLKLSQLQDQLTQQ